MVRINVVEPELLLDQHLLAEYREIRLHTAMLQRSLNSSKGVNVAKIPKQYTLNKGHAIFFYDKGLYLYKRFNLLKQELIKRGFDVVNEFEVDKWPKHLFNDWQPDSHARNVNIERIKLRVSQKPHFYRYYKRPVLGDFK